MVDHDDLVAQPLRLVHVVGGEQQGLAVALEIEQALPDHDARLRVEPGGRLVQDHQLRIADQGAREDQAALHAAGELIDAALDPLAELHEIEQRRDAQRDLPPAAG